MEPDGVGTVILRYAYECFTEKKTRSSAHEIAKCCDNDVSSRAVFMHLIAINQVS